MQKVKISSISANPNNPRVIKDDKFKKLVKSIQDFPRMLELRPIVVNNEMVVLGGNMRLRACKEAGLTEVPVIKADDLTVEQQAEFIVKDNVGFGEWDWDVIANEWNVETLKGWGLDFPIILEPVKLKEDLIDNSISVTIQTTDNNYSQMQEKLENLCKEYNAVLKVK